MQKLQKDNIGVEAEQIPEKLWHNLIRKQYTIPSIKFQLSGQQVTKLLQQNYHSDLNILLTEAQTYQISEFLEKSKSKVLYLKLNNRTPKDLPHLSREIHNINDFLTVLHSSEYLLETLDKNKEAEVVLRQFVPELGENLNVYQIYVKNGVVVAIGQKFCDHIEQQLNQQTVKKIIQVAQQIMPALTLSTPPPHPINSFIVTLSLHLQSPKIFSLRYYPNLTSNPVPSTSIFSSSQLLAYQSKIQQKQHCSSQQKYEQNEGIVPLVKTITKQQDIKHYDMGQYLMGNEIVDKEMMGEWKQFIKESEGKMAQKINNKQNTKQVQKEEEE